MSLGIGRLDVLIMEQKKVQARSPFLFNLYQIYIYILNFDLTQMCVMYVFTVIEIGGEMRLHGKMEAPLQGLRLAG
jgi:hypothetical protein